MAGATDDLSITELLDRVKARPARIHTLYLVATWEESGSFRNEVENKLARPAWEDQTLYSDDLGRVRHVLRRGSFDAQGARVSSDEAEQDLVYDGERTADIRHMPSRDRVGKAIKSVRQKSDVASVRQEAGYRTAQIYDGLFPPPHGPRLLRSPLTFLDVMFLSSLERAVELGLPVRLKESGEAARIYQLKYDISPAIEPNRFTYEVDLDGNRDWVITQIRIFRNASLYDVSQCQYRLLKDGIWVPTEGFTRRLSPQQATVESESRVRVKDIRINEPDFPPSAFDIALPPDTVVVDDRYRVQYRVGSEGAIDAHLDALARAAGGARSGIAGWYRRPLGWIIIGGNILLAVLIALLLRSRLPRMRRSP